VELRHLGLDHITQGEDRKGFRGEVLRASQEKATFTDVRRETFGEKIGLRLSTRGHAIWERGVKPRGRRAEQGESVEKLYTRGFSELGNDLSECTGPVGLHLTTAEFKRKHGRGRCGGGSVGVNRRENDKHAQFMDKLWTSIFKQGERGVRRSWPC